MKKSKLTTKHQATIPQEVRKVLKVKAGDHIIFEVLPDNTVVIRKGMPFDLEYTKALNTTLTEWASKNDEDAYRDL